VGALPNPTYAVFDEDTGEVVHVHVDGPGLETPAEELMHIADPVGNRRLSVRQLPEALVQRPVHLKDGVVRQAEDETGAHGGGGVDSPFVEPEAERRYERSHSPHHRDTR
jgi:hypothetical protein